MAYGAVFTTSDPGGGRPYTRFLGPLLIGVASTDSTVGMEGEADHAGSASKPAISFYGRPDMGIYSTVLTAAAGDLRIAAGGTRTVSLTSATARITPGGVFAWTMTSKGAGVVTTSDASAGGFYSTAATAPNLYIPATTGALSTAAAPMLLSTYMVPIAFDTVGKQLWIYSSNTGWVGIGPTSSGGNLWVTSSAA